MYGTILVPVDGSEASKRALEHGLSIAEMSRAQVHILIAVDKSEAADFDRQILEEGRHFDKLRKKGHSVIQDLLDTMDVPPVETKKFVVLETPQRAIGEYIHNNPVDLVVMGRTGKSNVQRLLLGSVSDRIIKLSDTPVMVVK